jgi:hypothetical protein
MTRDSGIMEIFHQNGPFSKVLVVWAVRVQALVIRGVNRKMAGSLNG